jgi:hypothetical protein
MMDQGLVPNVLALGKYLLRLLLDDFVGRRWVKK